MTHIVWLPPQQINLRQTKDLSLGYVVYDLSFRLLLLCLADGGIKLTRLPEPGSGTHQITHSLT